MALILAEVDKKLREDLRRTMNENSVDNICNTPDYVLADMLLRTLAIFRQAHNETMIWHGKKFHDKIMAIKAEEDACPNWQGLGSK